MKQIDRDALKEWEALKQSIYNDTPIDDSMSPAEIEKLLLTVENWDELPVSALAHAVMAGTAFPLPDRPMRLEELDTLAARFAREREDLNGMLKCVTGSHFSGSWQSLTWARALALADELLDK